MWGRGVTRPDPAAEAEIAVVGGGLAGLTAALVVAELRPAARLVVLERERTAGGKVRSESAAGYTLDWGPNGFLPAPVTLDLAGRLGLQGELVTAAPAARDRFLFRRGRLHLVRPSPLAFARSGLLSLPGKLRAAREPFVPPGVGEETVSAFLRRRFGPEFARAFAHPLVAGVAAGDPDELSLDALFPQLRALEQRHGSLLRGLAAGRKARRRAGAAPARLTTLRGGMGRLTAELRRRLAGSLREGVEVAGVERAEGGYRLRLAGGGELTARVVLLAVPAGAAAGLLRDLAPGAAAALRGIPYAPADVLGLGFRRRDLAAPPAGFGFLAARGEGLRSLGVLYASSVFPEQAPEGAVLLRVIAGGALDPGFAALPDGEALAAVREDLRRALGITAEPAWTGRVTWPVGIPQYTLGHAGRVAGARAALGPHPGLLLAGNAYDGVGVNDTIRGAEAAARAAVELLAVP